MYRKAGTGWDRHGGMRRYTITLGAGTTSGGTVVSASSSSRIHDMPIALEGDLVSCPVCKSTGRILCVGPRIPEMLNGKHVALENDFCTCHCTPSPRLLANQTARSQVIKDTGSALSHAVEADAAPRRPHGSGKRLYSGRFVLVDHHTGAPLANQEYAVVRQSGRLEFGTSDAQGQTHVLSATINAESVEIYV